MARGGHDVLSHKTIRGNHLAENVMSSEEDFDCFEIFCLCEWS